MQVAERVWGGLGPAVEDVVHDLPAVTPTGAPVLVDSGRVVDTAPGQMSKLRDKLSEMSDYWGCPKCRNLTLRYEDKDGHVNVATCEYDECDYFDAGVPE